jgi:hypothetical protein
VAASAADKVHGEQEVTNMGETMTDPVATFVQRWNALVTAPATDDGERWRSFRQAAGEAAAQLGPDAERLVAVIGHGNPVAADLLFDAIDSLNESPPASAGQQRGGTLGLLPIILVHRSDPATLPRNLGLSAWLPALPDGRAVPGLVDLLLTWEQISSPATTTIIHQVLRGDPAADSAGELQQRLESTAGRSMFDGYRKVGADLWTLRFAPFYPPSGDTRLFPGRDEALAWSRDATDKAAARDGATDMRLLPAAPLPYRDALGFGLQQNVLAALEDLRQAFGAAIEAAREGKGPRLQLLVEPFGTASRGLAGFYRYSLLGEAGYASPLATGAAIPWRRLWFRRDAAEQRIHRLAQETLGLSCVVAPLIQDSGTLFMESGPSRTLLVLGPGAAAADAASPELSITSPAAPNEEQSRAWTQVEAAIEEQATTITDVLAAAAGVPPAALQVAASFVIREHAWRPAFTIYRRDDAADGAVVPLGLDDAALQATAIGLERQLGRKWIFCQQSGEQGFLSSAVTAPVAAG